jgi:hypothetical protein
MLYGALIGLVAALIGLGIKAMNDKKNKGNNQ